MTIVLLFLFGVFSVVGWWLFQQGLTSKPWLESGTETVDKRSESSPTPKAKIGLWVFLGVVGCLFALFTSGFFMRMEHSDWRALPLPPVVWLNTGLLIMASISLHFALAAARKHDLGSVKIWLISAGVATFGFLTGQVMAWLQLTEAGYVMTANPANSFFYMITAVHGLHILGGLVAWGRTTVAAWANKPMDDLEQRIDLCALYWHFLLLVWLVLLVVLVGWVDTLFAISH